MIIDIRDAGLNALVRLSKPRPSRFDVPLLAGPVTPGDEPTVEICRSYSYRLNLTNYGRSYEHVDFFASRKVSCPRSSSAYVSEDIYEECKAEVRAAVKDWLEAFDQKRKAVRAGAADVAELERGAA